MAIDCRPLAQITAEECKDLEKRLTHFYHHLPGNYYQIADQAANRYSAEYLPFHYDLVGRVSTRMAVCEFGCGTAHLCPEVEQRGGHYTGFDWSDALLRNNQRRFPNARFIPLENSISETFDLVASLYTIEHVVNPPAYLARMWNLCKPSGLLAVICPEFVNGITLPPSFFYGKTPRRLHEKLLTLSLSDLFGHIVELKLLAPHWRYYADSLPPGAFWINLKPRVLHGAEYTIDSDAVHLPRLKDLIWWFKQRGAAIVETSATMKCVPAEVLAHSCYVLARKPTAFTEITPKSNS
jgi:SAM-dependent methyltransferase